MRTITPEILTGRTREHLTALDGTEVLVHVEMKEPFRRLQKRAGKKGFDLRIVSSFRDFESQLRIWNAKARGERPLLDAAGTPLDFATLTPEAIASAILRWSAVPGASRHHWGTDIDVYDAKALPADYKIQLVPAEVNEGGMFAPLHDWLDEFMWEEGFFRPYQEDQGGVSPERWHLSYAPVSQSFRQHYKPDLLRTTLQAADIALKDVLLRQVDTIFTKYVDNICNPIWY
jgi:LAS superfamily LD-carboxypeptidase LdcB